MTFWGEALQLTSNRFDDELFRGTERRIAQFESIRYAKAAQYAFREPRFWKQTEEGVIHSSKMFFTEEYLRQICILLN